MKKLKLFRTLLVAAMLGVGGSAWARTITYDFKSAVGDGGIAASSLTKGSSAGKNNSTDIFYPVELTSELQNRFAFQYREKDSKTNAWSVDKSRGGLWVNCASGVDDYFSIFNLKAGDVVTITLETGKIFFSTASANATYDVSGTPTTPAQWEELSSGTEYTIKSDGKLDLQAKKYNASYGHCIISKVVIETSDDETIETAPVIAVTGTNGGTREITITSFDTSLGNGTTTYYTLDGKTPTASSTEYTAAFNISAADDTDDDGIVVVKAISCKTGETTIASSVTTLNVSVGTAVPLNAPVITLTAFAANGGVFNPTYSFTSNQSNVIGSPAATLTYSFAGGAPTAGTSYTPTATGKLRVTASAEGYASTYTDLDITCAEYLKTYVFDATKDISVNDGAPTTYNNYSINSTGCRLYALSNCTYTIGKSISFDSHMQFAWAITANKAYCLFARTNKSTINYSLNDGEYIEFTNFGTPVVASSATTSTTLAWYSSVRQINVYTPANFTVSATIGATGYTTFSSAYPLNLDGITGGSAYYVSATTSTAATLAEATGTVAAGEGLLLSGTPGAKVTIPVAATGTAISGNKLVGCPTSTTLTVNSSYYVLVNNGGTAQFQCLDANGATIPAGKAYLNAAGAGARLDFVFEDEATGISNVSSQMEEGIGYYDLQGRRVAQPTKGLYIVNGKKMVIK